VSTVVIEALVKTFGAVRAVDGVSFTVPAGTILTMLGPSGCGKTTILRCIAGLEQPDGGSITIGGRLVHAGGKERVPAERRNLGMVFQSYAIWPHMTVFDNVAFGLRIRRRGRAELTRAVKDALALVQLADFEHRYPTQLSGGQMQRVVLARCLAYRPELLLLDEPLANLDAGLREEMRAELKRIQRETGTTMIAVTHDQLEALALSDHILVMNGGRVLQGGAPWEVFERPLLGDVAGFMGASNVLDVEIDTQGAAVLPGIGTLPGIVSARPGSRMQVYLRPEDIDLHPGAPAAGDPGWSGTVESTQYLGRHVRYRVRCGELRLMADRPVLGPPLEENTAVTVRFSAAGLRAFPARDSR